MTYMRSMCQLSSLAYFIPMCLLILYTNNYNLAFLFLLLIIFAFFNHSREYTDKPLYDVIDVVDRILILTICFYFLIFHNNFLLVWISLLYMLVAYFVIIPKCCTKRSKTLTHSSFHIVTAISATLVVSRQLYISDDTDVSR